MSVNQVQRLLLVILLAVLSEGASAQNINVKKLMMSSESMLFLNTENRVLLSLPELNGESPALGFMEPVFGTITERLELNEDPGAMALSSDETVLYLCTSTQILRIAVATRQIEYSIPLEKDRFVYDVEILPGNNDAICVLTADASFNSKALMIYDEDVLRPDISSGISANTITFGDSPAVVYGYNNKDTGFGIHVFNIDVNGIQFIEKYRGIGNGFDQNIEFAKGSVWTDGGRRIDISNTIPLLQGEFSLGGSSPLRVIAPYLDEDKMITYGSDGMLRIHNANTFNPIKQYKISSFDKPIDMISWAAGINLVLRTTGNLHQDYIFLISDCQYAGTISSTLTIEKRFCSGDTLVLSAKDDAEMYYWSTGETSKTIQVSNNGEYSYRLADASGCLSSSVEIFKTRMEDFTSAPSIFTDKSRACYEEQVELEGSFFGSGAIAYIWSTGDTNEIISVQGPGPYSLSVQNDIGCQTPSRTIMIDTIDQFVPEKPSLVLEGDLIFCPQTPPILIASGGYFKYDWQPNISDSDTAVITFSGEVSVRVSNDENCWSVRSDTIVFESFDVDTSVPVIQKNGARLASSIASGNQWYMDNMEIVGATGQFLELTEMGSYKTRVTQLDCFVGESNVLNYMTTSTEESINTFARIAPNPTYGTLEINGDLIFDSIKLVNTVGQTVIDRRLAHFMNSSQLDISKLSSGVYILLLANKGQVKATFKVIRI